MKNSKRNVYDIRFKKLLFSDLTLQLNPPLQFKITRRKRVYNTRIFFSLTVIDGWLLKEKWKNGTKGPKLVEH